MHTTTGYVQVQPSQKLHIASSRKRGNVQLVHFADDVQVDEVCLGYVVTDEALKRENAGYTAGPSQSGHPPRPTLGWPRMPAGDSSLFGESGQTYGCALRAFHTHLREC